MHHRCPTNERSKETDHEIDGVIRRQNAQVTHARRKRINGCECDALLEVILVRHHAAFGAAAGARRIYDACHIFARALNEDWLAAASELLPALRASEIG